MSAAIALVAVADRSIDDAVDPSVAIKVSGHQTRAMLDRYNIIGEQETAEAFRMTDEYLSTQPAERNVVPLAAPAQNPHKPGRARG